MNKFLKSIILQLVVVLASLRLVCRLFGLTKGHRDACVDLSVPQEFQRL